jgi:Recombination endonuclease VII
MSGTKKPCSVPECERPVAAKGMCFSRYDASRDRGVCSQVGCALPMHARRLCSKHYSASYKTGTLPPLIPRRRQSREEKRAYWQQYARKRRSRPEIRARDNELERARRAKSPKRLIQQRKYRGLPDPTRPRPEVCEVPGCARKATILEHCHVTGAFRGWVCRRCNLFLGCLGDDLLAFDKETAALREYLVKTSLIAQFDYVDPGKPPGC